jgi:hypothetical protein
LQGPVLVIRKEFFHRLGEVCCFDEAYGIVCAIGAVPASSDDNSLSNGSTDESGESPGSIGGLGEDDQKDESGACIKGVVMADSLEFTRLLTLGMVKIPPELKVHPKPS